jgi:hypothetical protein
VAYRGDETDPLAIMTSRQREMRRAALFALMIWVVPALIRFDYGQLTQLAELVSASARPPAPAAAAPLTMTGQVLEQQLRLAPVSGGAPRDHRCVPGAPGFNGWDYVCSYTVGEPLAARRMKIGVRVTATAIVQASAPYPFEHVLPAASQAGGAY